MHVNICLCTLHYKGIFEWLNFKKCMFAEHFKKYITKIALDHVINPFHVTFHV